VDADEGRRDVARSMLDEVHAAYIRARSSARETGDRRLRRQARRMQRRRHRLDQPGLARLRALSDELRHRRLPA
jgi:hypothetical protein